MAGPSAIFYVLVSLAFCGVDEYREAFDMALESCFEVFDSEYGCPQVPSASYPELRFKNASRPMELEMVMEGATGNV